MNAPKRLCSGVCELASGTCPRSAAVSGPGLDVVTDRTPAEITARALLGEDRYAAQAVDMFFCFLGTVAGDLALTLAARGGIYLAGGILPQIAQALVGSRFRERR
ncbi:MAG: glucokinase [Chromatiales bacterium]